MAHYEIFHGPVKLFVQEKLRSHNSTEITQIRSSLLLGENLKFKSNAPFLSLSLNLYTWGWLWYHPSVASSQIHRLMGYLIWGFPTAAIIYSSLHGIRLESTSTFELWSLLTRWFFVRRVWDCMMRTPIRWEGSSSMEERCSIAASMTTLLGSVPLPIIKFDGMLLFCVLSPW